MASQSCTRCLLLVPLLRDKFHMPSFRESALVSVRSHTAKPLLKHSHKTSSFSCSLFFFFFFLLQPFRLLDDLLSTADCHPFFETFIQFDSGFRSVTNVLFEFCCHRQKIFFSFVALSFELMCHVARFSHTMRAKIITKRISLQTNLFWQFVPDFWSASRCQPTTVATLDGTKLSTAGKGGFDHASTDDWKIPLALPTASTCSISTCTGQVLSTDTASPLDTMATCVCFRNRKEQGGCLLVFRNGRVRNLCPTHLNLSHQPAIRHHVSAKRSPQGQGRALFLRFVALRNVVQLRFRSLVLQGTFLREEPVCTGKGLRNEPPRARCLSRKMFYVLPLATLLRARCVGVEGILNAFTASPLSLSTSKIALALHSSSARPGDDTEEEVSLAHGSGIGREIGAEASGTGKAEQLAEVSLLSGPLLHNNLLTVPSCGARRCFRFML